MNYVTKLYDIIARYQVYVLGLAIFMASLAMSYIYDGQGFRLILADLPILLIILVFLSMLAAWLYVMIDKRRINALKQEIVICRNSGVI